MLDGRQAIIEHHVLHMQLVFFPLQSSGFIFRQFNVTVFSRHQFHRIIHNDSNIAGHQFQEQTVVLPFRFGHTTQSHHTYTMPFLAHLHAQREAFDFTGSVHLHQSRCEASVHFFPHLFLILIRNRECVFQDLALLIINGHSQYIDGNEFVHFLGQLLNQRKCHLLFLLALRYRNVQCALGHFQYMLQVIPIGQTMAQIQQVITDQQCNEQNHAKNHRHDLIVGRHLHLDAILFQRGIHTNLLIKRGVSLVVIPIPFQITQSKECHGRFITHIEQGKIIRIKSFGKPIQFDGVSHSHQL